MEIKYAPKLHCGGVELSAIFAWPAELKWRDPGVALTFVVPAVQCNLSCSFCAIRQRREMNDSALSITDYEFFIDEIVAVEPTAMISIQGYEPLLPEAWPYTRAILSRARDLGVPSSLVTNGVLLAERAQELADLNPTGVTVSIDAAAPEDHDRIRGRDGAFAATLRGVKAIAGINGFAGRVTISSVLMPRRRGLLDGLPAVMTSVGVRHWAISPLLRIKRGVIGGAVAPSSEVIRDVLELNRRATAAGVTVVLDDELGCLEEGSEHYDSFLIRRFDRPDGLVRLTPSGACSVGREILSEVDASTPIWNRDIPPAAFIEAARSRLGGSSTIGAL